LCEHDLLEQHPDDYGNDSDRDQQG
jgi:hypothetical protein